MKGGDTNDCSQNWSKCEFRQVHNGENRHEQAENPRRRDHQAFEEVTFSEAGRRRDALSASPFFFAPGLVSEWLTCGFGGVPSIRFKVSSRRFPSGFSMDQFRRLDPHMRSLALVGNFLQHWALVESKLNAVVIKSLGLTSLSGLIVVRNIQFRDKTKIAKTAIQMSFLDDGEKQRYKKIIDSISDFSTKRNVVAHELFYESADGSAVEFSVIKANGDLKFPYEAWTLDEFDEHFTRMMAFHKELSGLLPKLGRAEIVKALISAQDREPTQPLSALGLGGLLSLPVPITPDSTRPEATRQKPPRRRATPRPKDGRD